jgi:4-hydroxybenzoate polyprenyltransferase
MKSYLKLLRIKQWIKNIFVFAPLFFSNNLFVKDYWYPSILSFFSFCFISSSIYCLNDLCDVKLDRLHPRKKTRPIALGEVSIKGGYIFMLLCALISVVIVLILSPYNFFNLLCVIMGYWILNVAYCLKLKRYAILDVIIISFGFVLRVLAGGIALGIWVSHWLILLTFLLALFLAFTKRYDDFSIYEKTGIKPRVSISGYNKFFIGEASAIIASITVVCYIMYTMSEEVTTRMGSRYTYLTSVWVLAGILRYLQTMIVYNQSGSPTRSLVNDHFIHLCVVGWLLSFFFIIYL